MSPAGSAPYPLSPLIRPPEEHGCCRWAALDLEFHTVLSAVSQMSLDVHVCSMMVERRPLSPNGTWFLPK